MDIFYIIEISDILSEEEDSMAFLQGTLKYTKT